jgi:hypothetical protein
MTLANFTIFGNPQIKSFFQGGSDYYIPSSELVYLHEHPMIKDSFLGEIEALINKSTECLLKHNMQGPIVEKFIMSTQILGALLPDVNKDNAPDILKELRVVYNLCTGLFSDLNFK